jgi:hypothetical protein
MPIARVQLRDYNHDTLTDEKDPLLEALWQTTLEAWDDEKRHAACLEHALREKKLPDLAGRYKALKDDPEKGELAKKRIDAILTAATQMMLTMKTPRPTKTPSWLFWSAFLTCLVMALYVAYAFLHR